MKNSFIAPVGFTSLGQCFCTLLFRGLKSGTVAKVLLLCCNPATAQCFPVNEEAVLPQ